MLRSSSSIIEKITDLEANTSPALAYFFFDGRDAQTGQQRHDGLLRSLIAQFARQCDGIPPALRVLYGHGDQRPSTVALQKTLGQLLDGFEKPYIVIDALDECTETEQVLAWIRDVVSRKAGGVRLVVTSRPEREILDVFRDLDSQCVNLATEASNNDIRAYLLHELATDRKLRKWYDDEEIRDEITWALLDGAQGM